jgi:hypothetical protein
LPVSKSSFVVSQFKHFQIVPHQSWTCKPAPNEEIPSDHCPLLRVFQFKNTVHFANEVCQFRVGALLRSLCVLQTTSTLIRQRSSDLEVGKRERPPPHQPQAKVTSALLLAGAGSINLYVATFDALLQMS